ncbi:MAG: hypothetical protein OXC99_05515 [Chloroflexi bacterium]|nr:hypothetical protein [Chloroflexota bacterium]
MSEGRHTITNRRIAITLLCLLIALAAGGGYLYIDERTTRNHLQQSLHDADQALAVEREARKEVEIHNLTLLQDNTALTSSLAGVNAQLTTAADLETQLRSEIENAADRYATLTKTKDSIDNERRELFAENQTLIATHGDIATLEAKKLDVLSAIAALEDRRRALIIPVTHTEGFACTGSMEPKITCLDTATWLTNPEPHEVVVGSVIAFNSSVCWDEEDTSFIAHRVIDIDVRARQVDYRHLPQFYARQNNYLTKGDANPDTDCWVPHAAVAAYIIELHKNTRPENAWLRDSVNAAKRDFFRALDDHQAKYDHYVELRNLHNCPARVSQPCTRSDTDLIRAFNAEERASTILDIERSHYTCWIKVARSSSPSTLHGDICGINRDFLLTQRTT